MPVQPLQPGTSCITGTRVLSFQASHSLDVRHLDGPLITLLECDSNELLGSGWHSVVQKCDRDPTDTMKADIQHGLGGHYLVRATAKLGDTFILDVRSIVDPERAIARGHVAIRGYVLNQKHFPITNAVRLKGIV